VTIVLSAQLALLIATFAVVIVLGRPTGLAQYVLLTLYAFSMGMQSAAFRVLRVPGILGTTYLTGNLVAWFSALAVGRAGLSSAASLVSLVGGAAAEIVLARRVPRAAGALPVLLILSVLIVSASPDFRSTIGTSTTR
jgi:uncharacterized membrane protein YoaK (UPF0700 family)